MNKLEVIQAITKFAQKFEENGKSFTIDDGGTINLELTDEHDKTVVQCEKMGEKSVIYFTKGCVSSMRSAYFRMILSQDALTDLRNILNAEIGVD